MRHSLFASLTLALALTAFPFDRAAAELTEEKRAEASELFKEYNELASDPEARSEVAEKMIALGPEVAAILYKQIHPAWERALREYQQAFSMAAQSVSRSRASGADRAKIEEHRATLRRLRGAGNLSKEMLKAEGGPALQALRNLTGLEVDDVLSENPELTAHREKFLLITGNRERARDKAILLTEPRFDEEKLDLREKETVEALRGSESGDILAVLAENRKRASQVDPAEAAGVRDLNAMRILLGLRPVLLDPKLTAASKGHSEDMANLKFFAHDSPVEGKENPWKRAKLAGTSASAENIYVGSSDPAAANRGWFFSPGHHKNMFANHARVGMGNYGRHWTQMFGN